MATSTYAAQSPATARPVTEYGYDSFGDQTQAQDPDGHVTTTAYDGDGRATSVTQPSYTAPGSSSAITAATKYAYDGNGNLISQTDPAGNTTTYAYDALGDLITQTDPQLTGQSAPGTWTYTYDSDGEPLSSTSPTGAQTQATYDYFGDLATSTQDVRSSSGTAYDTTSYTYDYLGDPLTTKSPGRRGHHRHLRSPGRADLHRQRRRRHHQLQLQLSRPAQPDHEPGPELHHAGLRPGGEPDLGPGVRDPARPARGRRPGLDPVLRLRPGREPDRGQGRERLHHHVRL